MNQPGTFTRIFFWLSGASTENLQDCPTWERRKYVAFGATVLVPCVFALIAAAYAVGTISDNPWTIGAVAIAWAFIILTVDRALLATYRAYQSFFRKVSQFSLRLVVAGLMGLTISHPLTLLLFKDTVSSVIEKDRDAEINAVHDSATAQKKTVEARIAALDAEIAATRQKWDETFSARFLAGEEQKAGNNTDDKKARTEMETKIAGAQAPAQEKLQAVEKEIAAASDDARKLQAELDFWQREFEREVNGQRSGIIGLGPRAKSIHEDQLTWRRDESKRLATVLEVRTNERNALRADIAAIEQRMLADAAMKAADLAMKQKIEQDRLDGLKRQVQQQQADQFVGQQNQIRETLKAQIDARLDQARTYQEETTRLGDEETTRVAAIRAEPRRDILKQTLALHRLFREGAEGGVFALTAYVVLTLLFMIVDIIPVMVKFVSKPGPYDTLVDCDEVRYDGEHATFIQSFRRYMDELAGGRLLHLTRHKPMEQALIEGVERSRVAKEFLESLMELEKAFQLRVQTEREALAPGNESERGERHVMLQHMADTFYRDLRARMERFFADADPVRAAS